MDKKQIFTIKKKKIIFYIFMTVAIVMTYFFSAFFYKNSFAWNSEYDFKIVFKWGTLKFFIASGIGMCIYLSVLFLQKLVKNKMASPSILGISQINFIIYALVFAINRPLFKLIFLSSSLGFRTAEWLLYFLFSFLISFLIIWISNKLKEKYIIIIGIFINIILAGISLLILKNTNNDHQVYEVYKKMLGSFVVLEGGEKFSIFAASLSNVLGILGLIYWKYFHLRIEKNILLKEKGQTLKGNLLATRILLFTLVSLYSSLAFFMGGSIVFFGIAILMFARTLFRDHESSFLLPGFLLSILFTTTIDVLENNVFKDIIGDVPEGLYLALVGIPIIFVQLIKRR